MDEWLKQQAFHTVLEAGKVQDTHRLSDVVTNAIVNNAAMNMKDIWQSQISRQKKNAV
jgi:hypothetical protein